MVSLQKSFSIADRIPFLTPTVSECHFYHFHKITSHKIKNGDNFQGGIKILQQNDDAVILSMCITIRQDAMQ